MTTCKMLLPANAMVSLMMAVFLISSTTAPVLANTARPMLLSAGNPFTGTPSAGTQKDSSVKDSRGKDSSVMVVSLERQQGKLDDLLKAQVAKAIALHRTPYVVLGAEWCGPCHALDDSMKDARMIEAFEGTYIIRVDFNDWDTNLLYALGMAGSGLPRMFALDKEGKGTGPSLTDIISGDIDPATMAPQFKKYFSGHRWP